MYHVELSAGDDDQYALVLNTISFLRNNATSHGGALMTSRVRVDMENVEFVEHSITQSILDELKQVEGIQSILFSRCTYSFDEVRFCQSV